MPNTYTELKRTVLSTSASTITLDNIPQTYTDLILVFQATGASANMNWDIRVGNGTVDSGSNYSATYLVGGSGGASSNRVSNQTAMRLGFSAYIQASGGNFMAVTQIMNYSNTTTNKTVISRDGNVNLGAEAAVGLWRSTSAINIITVGDFGGSTMAAGTTVSLYGIANADQGAAKATGGIITEDSQYWYHTFGASSAFVPKQSLSCDVLVVAGGGGAAAQWGGGAGAGGIFYATSQALTAISYNVTVGGGGAGTSGYPGNGTNGTNTTFGALTAAVGGGKSGGDGGTGSNGGSGGGFRAGSGTFGTSTQTSTGGTGYGNSGGGATGSPSASGGGAAGGAGGASTGPTTGGAGGVGTTVFSSWGTVTGIGENVSGTYYLAGGGGGCGNAPGAAGLGGGGIGGNASASGIGGNGLANTGGGGGGGFPGTGGTGGAGVVIIRYSK
jgi:hypothetical protein